MLDRRPKPTVRPSEPTAPTFNRVPEKVVETHGKNSDDIVHAEANVGLLQIGK